MCEQKVQKTTICASGRFEQKSISHILEVDWLKEEKISQELESEAIIDKDLLCSLCFKTEHLHFLTASFQIHSKVKKTWKLFMDTTLYNNNVWFLYSNVYPKIAVSIFT